MNKLILAVVLIVTGSYFSISTAEAARRHPTHAHKAHKAHHRPHSHQQTVSWYGADFHGKKTANGERFNMYAMTAAHRTLPLSSYAEVINPKNHRSVIVRINDRGPFHGNRSMDLSYAAAKRLGIKGIAAVQIKPLGSGLSVAQLIRNPLNDPS